MAATTKRARYGQMSRAPKDINIKGVPADVRNGMLRLKRSGAFRSQSATWIAAARAMVQTTAETVEG